MRYCPVLSVTAVRAFSMRAELDASTVTPGNTAADVSRTTPAIVAWAKRTDGSSRIPASAATMDTTRRMTNLHAFAHRVRIPAVPHQPGRRADGRLHRGD